MVGEEGMGRGALAPEIPIRIESYDDIFSDFDSRGYSNRALSTDFLSEIHRASRDKMEGQISLRFSMPESKRVPSQERVIKLRLKEHFSKHHSIIHKEAKSIRSRGAGFSIFGVVLMFIATYLLIYYPEKGLLLTFLIVLLEPGGWFLFWEGLRQIIFEPERLKPELEFYDKMIRSEISFHPAKARK